MEPGLESSVRNSVESGKLRASQDTKFGDLYHSCSTPLDDQERPDTSFIKAAITDLSAILRKVI